MLPIIKSLVSIFAFAAIHSPLHASSLHPAYEEPKGALTLSCEAAVASDQDLNLALKANKKFTTRFERTKYLLLKNREAHFRAERVELADRRVLSPKQVLEHALEHFKGLFPDLTVSQFDDVPELDGAEVAILRLPPASLPSTR